MTVANWFLTKNYSQNECYAMNTTEPTIERETEKAYLLKFDTEFGTIKGWFPKSACTADAPVVANEFKVGDTVKHSTFGEGVVVKIVKDIVNVKFGNSERLIAKAWLNA